MSILASVSESVMAIRCRFAPPLRQVFPLPFAHPSEVSVRPTARHAALMALPHFLIVQPRDLQRHLTRRCSRHLLTLSPPRSSESVPRSEQGARARLV